MKIMPAIENIPPEQLLREAKETLPDLDKLIGLMISGKGVDLPNWANWCFLPVAGWLAIAESHHDVSRLMQIALGNVYAAVGIWQYSKGIYTFDHDFALDLLNSPLNSDIPSNVLLRLPEFCIYIDISNVIDDVPELRDYFGEQTGFFVYLEDDGANNRSELRFFAQGCGVVPLHLGQWSVDIAIDRFWEESIRNATGDQQRTLLEMQDAGNDYLFPVFSRLINLVLYICSNEPDIQTDRESNYRQYLPAPVKTKKGIRLFPAEKIHQHKIGWNIGETLRRNKTSAETEPIEWQGGTKRAHLRRGHWHGFWRGPRKSDDREFIFHWIPPLIAGGKR